MHGLSEEMRKGVEAAAKCHALCLGMALNHCLEVGGRHVEPGHFKLMMACATICQTAADFMMIGTVHHKHVCRECAEICRECAASCEAVGDMDACVQACRDCAESCEAMAA